MAMRFLLHGCCCALLYEVAVVRPNLKVMCNGVVHHQLPAVRYKYILYMAGVLRHQGQLQVKELVPEIAGIVDLLWACQLLQQLLMLLRAESCLGGLPSTHVMCYMLIAVAKVLRRWLQEAVLPLDQLS